MPAGSVLTHDFAGPGDFESFRDGLPGFVARDRFRHKARKIAQLKRLTTAFPLWAGNGPQETDNKVLASNS